MAKEKSIKAGLLGVGLNTYWNQFEGLRERLEEYQNEIGRRMGMSDVKVINVSIVDSQESAGVAVEKLLKNRIDVLFVYVSTYALSSTILPVVQECRVPVLLLNIQPTAAIDFKFVNGLDDRGRMTGEWLAYCQACSIPEFASVFNRSGIKYDIITGYLSDESMWKEIKDWLDAVRVVKGMRENRMGILGHYYTGMLDVYTDVTLQSAIFGTYIEQVEMCELAHYYESATEDELQAKLNEFHEKFDVSSQCEEYELQRAARTSIALDKLVEAHRLGSLAYYYEGFPGNSYENLVTSVIAGNTLLTGRGIPVAGECEVKNVQAIIKRGTILYEKIAGFTDTFLTLGDRMATLQKDYDKALNQLSEGNGSVVRQAEMLKDMSLTPKKRISARLLPKEEIQEDAEQEDNK